VSLEGIVSRCSEVRTRIGKCVFSDSKNQQLSANHDTNKTLPGVLKDENVELDYDLSEYIDNQIIQIRDNIDHTTTGQLPRIVEVECENDIADICKAGDRVQQIIGVYYFNAPKKTSIFFDIILKANNVIHLNCHNNAQNFSLEDVTKCRKLVKGSDDTIATLN